MDRKEAIERLFYLKSKAENALINSNSYCDWLINDVKGTINAFSMAIEALQEPEIVHCKDCRHWDKEIMYCNHTGMQIEPDGYCVYGERKE